MEKTWIGANNALIGGGIRYLKMRPKFLTPNPKPLLEDKPFMDSY